MKSFLVKDKIPICKWGQIPHEIYFEGSLPEDHSLAICPHDPYIILDIDRHGEVDGFDSIPQMLSIELLNHHFSYSTKNNGLHVWLKYTGSKNLANKTSGLGIDLRTSKGYVRWYLDKDIRSYIHLIKDSSLELNKWLEELFSYNNL